MLVILTFNDLPMSIDKCVYILYMYIDPSIIKPLLNPTLYTHVHECPCWSTTMSYLNKPVSYLDVIPVIDNLQTFIKPFTANFGKYFFKLSPLEVVGRVSET